MPDPHFFDHVLAPGAALEGKLVQLRADGPATMLTGGVVLDGSGGRTAATVTIRGDRIEELVPADAPLRVPAGCQVVDCAGATVLPGLFDLHVHLMGTSEHDRARSHLVPRSGVRALRLGFEAYELLAHGVTTILDLGHGDAEHVYGLREAIAAGIVHGPRILNVGWYLAPTHESESNLPHELATELRIAQHTPADGVDEITALLRSNAADGAEWTKFYFTPDPRQAEPWYTTEELSHLVGESHRLGMRVACHAKSVAAVRAAVEAGVDCVEHGPDVVDERLLDLMARRGTYLVPTLAVYERVTVVAAEFGYPPARVDAIRRELDGRMRNVEAARAAGIRVGVGSDVGARAGFGYLSTRELELLTQCGFSPMESVVAATGVSAECLGVAEEIGTLTPGKLAEIVVVDGDPLEDITVFQRPASIRRILQASGRLAPELSPDRGRYAGIETAVG